MNRSIEAFSVELKKNFLAMIRTYIWILGLFLFMIVALLSSIPSENENFKWLNDPYPISYFYYRFFENLLVNRAIIIIYLLSAIVISEDSESGRLDLVKAFKLPNKSIILAKYIWLLIYITICIAISTLIFSFYLFTKYYQFTSGYIPTILEVMFIFIAISMLAAFQGVFISSIFSKRISAVIGAIGYYLVLSIASSYFYSLYLNPLTVNLKNQLIMNMNGWEFVSPNFNILDKFIFLLDPSNFSYYAAYLLNIFAINVVNNNTGTIPNVPPVSIPFLFNLPEYQFIYVYIIQLFIFVLGIKLIEIIKKKVKS